MKKRTAQGTVAVKNLLNHLMKSIPRKSDKTEINCEENIECSKETRDMDNCHTPDFSDYHNCEMSREKAKEQLNRKIEERLAHISHIDIVNLEIDQIEKERQRARAAERINERRNRRKQKSSEKPETIITEEGVFSDFKRTSVFDLIEPEAYPFEGNHKEADEIPIVGQISIEEALAEARVDRILSRVEGVSQDEGSPRVEGDTHLDESIDLFFHRAFLLKTNVVRVLKKVGQTTIVLFLCYLKKPAQKGVGIIGQKLSTGVQFLDRKLHIADKLQPMVEALIDKEHAVSEQMCKMIDGLDHLIDLAYQKAKDAWDFAVKQYEKARTFCQRHKKSIIIGFGVSVAAASAITLVIGSMTAYEYIYNGKTLGVVKNQDDVYKTIDIIGDKLSCEYGAEITIDKEEDIRFKKVIAFHQVVDDKEDILNRLTYMRDMKANGHGIYVNDTLAAVLESEESANALLASIQNQYLSDNPNIQYKSVGFAENVTVKDVETKLGSIESEEQALAYLMTGAVAQQIHIVAKGETFSEIAKAYGMKQTELQATNPDVEPAKLKVGQEINLNRIVPLITVQTVEVAQYIDTIPYEITYENTASLYKNEQTVKSKGSNGEKDVVAEIVKNNGIEVSRTEISSTVLSEPVSQVVLVGTKDPPPLIGTGSFIYPIRGTLTSRFGYRWGRLHSGIDLAASIGTPIKASDGGVVTFAGYNGSLGYMVAIDHGGGRVTWYGHCSKLFVSKGDKVYQGQHIANVGNTGRSTGPHVHFEVHINGVAKNPLNYL